MAVTAMKVKSSVESLREIVQDLLAPELKALKVEVASIRSDMKVKLAAVRNEIALGFDSVRTEMRLRDEKQSQAMQALSDKLAYAIEIRELLAVSEDRSART